MMTLTGKIGALLSLPLLVSCSASVPRDIDDGCNLFDEKSRWYKDASASYKKWGVPIHLQLAFIHQESRFVDDAKPGRDYVLWVIPWGRLSDAYGYAQAKDSTWDWYIRETGNRGADRDDFGDAVDFIGWYVNYTHAKLGVSKWDVYHQYLAYHEGHGGYKRKTYKKKAWLQGVARKVEARAKRYRAQLGQCQARLEDSGWSLWPFD